MIKNKLFIGSIIILLGAFILTLDGSRVISILCLIAGMLFLIQGWKDER